MGLIEKFKAEQVKADARTAARRDHQAEVRAQASEREALRTHKFAGVTVRNGTISYKRTAGPAAGAMARVETAGQINERYTASRVLMVGVFALAFKKKKDNRQLYLAVEGQGFGFLVELDPDDRVKAERFAITVNGISRHLAHHAAAG